MQMSKNGLGPPRPNQEGHAGEKMVKVWAPALWPARVGLTGLEPVTLRLSSACSNQLSYRPLAGRGQVEARGLEPLTYSLQSYRSTS